MKITTTTFSTAAILSLLCTPAALANDNTQQGFSLGAKLGTLGLGLEADYAFNEKWNGRIQFNSYTYDDDFEEDDINYTGEIDLSSIGALVDYRPFSGAFRLSAGVYSNSNELNGTAVSLGNEVFDIGDLSYRGSSTDPLTLTTNVELGDGTAGYLGVGWGNTYGNGFKFSFEVGVLLSGSPTVSLDATGSAQLVGVDNVTFDVNDSTNPFAVQLQQEVEQEARNLEDDISDFEYYPVISVGFAYRF
ncbi:hypothetical protein [Alteromonas facilis]|uniref:hypothetical protein n=1 Tax=Alteromonas facilis TaxID=2048004 RepID=UPI000C28A61E|nr:hypothetical protein [Alteromonas facilis]